MTFFGQHQLGREQIGADDKVDWKMRVFAAKFNAMMFVHKRVDMFRRWTDSGFQLFRFENMNLRLNQWWTIIDGTEVHIHRWTWSSLVAQLFRQITTDVRFDRSRIVQCSNYIAFEIADGNSNRQYQSWHEFIWHLLVIITAAGSEPISHHWANGIQINGF